MSIDPAHDLMHTPDPKRERWRESYYFMFYDFNLQIGCFSGIGYRPSKGYSGSAQVMWGKGIPTLVASEYARYEKHNAVHPVAGLNYECIDPFQHWKVDFKGKLNRSGDDPAPQTCHLGGKGGARHRGCQLQR